MDKTANNFCVTSKGYCFICLNKIPYQFNQGTGNRVDTSSSSSFYSLQEISRYLKINMRTAFIGEGSVPPDLIARVEKSRLKVELCDGCRNLADNVSKHCRQLEKLKLEIESGLELIHGKIYQANQAGITEKIRKLSGSELNSGMGGWMDILEALRMEAMSKSSKKINSASPRLQIQRITRKEIHGATFRTPKQEEETSSEPILDLELQGISVKTEEPQTVNWPVEHDDQSENLFGDDDNNGMDDSISTSVDNEGSEINSRVMQKMTMKIRKKLQGKYYVINSTTGKYECQLCKMEYTSQSGFHDHYNIVHCKRKIKCEKCGKEFTNRSHHKRHLQNVHRGVRYQCQVCRKIFTRKDNLMVHQRKGECRNGK